MYEKGLLLCYHLVFYSYFDNRYKSKLTLINNKLLSFSPPERIKVMCLQITVIRFDCLFVLRELFAFVALHHVMISIVIQWIKETYKGNHNIRIRMYKTIYFGLCRRIKLRLRNAAYEMQLGCHVWGSWIKTSPFRLL